MVALYQAVEARLKPWSTVANRCLVWKPIKVDGLTKRLPRNTLFDLLKNVILTFAVTQTCPHDLVWTELEPDKVACKRKRLVNETLRDGVAWARSKSTRKDPFAFFAPNTPAAKTRPVTACFGSVRGSRKLTKNTA